MHQGKPKLIYYSGCRDVGWDSRQVCTQEHAVSQEWGRVGCGLPTEMLPTDQAPVFSSQQDFPGEKDHTRWCQALPAHLHPGFLTV